MYDKVCKSSVFGIITRSTVQDSRESVNLYSFHVKAGFGRVDKFSMQWEADFGSKLRRTREQNVCNYRKARTDNYLVSQLAVLDIFAADESLANHAKNREFRRHI